MNEILCSTGALLGRANGCNYWLLQEFAEHLDCDGYEFMMYPMWYEEVDELIAALKKWKLYIPVVHADKSIGERISKGGEENFREAFALFEINCRISKELGAKKVILHLWNGLASDLHFENQLGAYPVFNQIAARYEQKLLIENIVCNGKSPMERWCELKRAYPEIAFVYDTKMAEFHGQSHLLYEEAYEWLWKDGHICHYHVNDYGGGYKEWAQLRTLPVGAGHVDFEAFFQFIRSIGYQENFTLESTLFGADGKVDFEVMNRQIAYVREMLAKERLLEEVITEEMLV